MKFSENWLREWVNPDLDSRELAHRLTMLGLEVDGLEPVAQDLDGVLAARVVAVSPHRDADRLRVCQVSVGKGEALSIVCGAPNVVEGGIYPLAVPGTLLPGGQRVSESKIRGEASQGMLCSAVELGLAEESSGLLELDTDITPGQPISDVLELDDRVIDLDLTPNRADCFCVEGIARDIAAATRMPLSPPDLAPLDASGDQSFSVEVEDKAGNPRFVGRVIRGIDPRATSPLWLTERLRRSGIRPIHPVVDVTNYVLLELGQPMHAYDLDKLRGAIVVRQSRDQETLTLLDGESIQLTGDELLITDDSGPIGLAGIMGGLGTAVTEDTVNVFLEAAWFSPHALAGRARRFGMQTDASVRFERGVDPQGQARAMERASHLLLGIAGGEAGPTCDTRADAELPQPSNIHLRRSQLEKLLGMSVPDEEVSRLLNDLGMQVESNGTGWSVRSPSWRFDIAIEADLIEEVARLVGYEQIPETPGAFAGDLGPASEEQIEPERLRNVLVQRGYREIISYSFISTTQDELFALESGAGLALANPISSEQSVMRRSLLPGLAAACAANLKRQHQRVRIFEHGVRFIPQDAKYKEINTLSGLITGSRWPEQWSAAAESVDLFDLKTDLAALLTETGNPLGLEWTRRDFPVLWPGRSMALVLGDDIIGLAGQLHPRLSRRLELPEATQVFELDLDSLCRGSVTKFEEISRFPSVRRDIALLVDEAVTSGELVAAARAAIGDLVRDVVIFDVYMGNKVEAGQKSVALGLILQENSRTLTDQDAEDAVTRVKTHLSRDFKATIRE